MVELKTESRKELEQKTRRAVYVRDNYSCVLCGTKGVQIHEVVPRSALGKNQSEFLFAERNRVCLCPTCHMKAHTRQERQKAFEYLKSLDYQYTEEERRIIHKYVQ